jgi:hypothetical protein
MKTALSLGAFLVLTLSLGHRPAIAAELVVLVELVER